METINHLKNEKGFSLIEILIALGIFAIGSLAVVALFYSTSGSVRKSTEVSEAVFIAEDALNRTLLKRYDSSGCTACMKSEVLSGYGQYDVTVGVVYNNTDKTAIVTVAAWWGTGRRNNVTLQYIRAETKNSDI